MTKGSCQLTCPITSHSNLTMPMMPATHLEKYWKNLATLQAALGSARRAFAFSLGSLTLVIIFSFSMAAMMYQVMSTCHHSRPWRALDSKAWWLLCQPSPQARMPTHLHREQEVRRQYKSVMHT